MVGVVLLLASGLFLRPVTKLKPALTPSGEVERRPDGGLRYREDKWGTFWANWDAYLIMACGSACLLWAAGRGVIALYLRVGDHHEQT